MSRRVLVTGSSGYLGSVLVSALLKHPLVGRVVGVDLEAPAGSQDPKIRFHAADIRDEFLLRSIMEEENVDTVFHLAFAMGESRDEVRAREINLGGTLTVLEAAGKTPSVEKVIFSGSASAYGAKASNPEFLTEESPLRADTLTYGIHKRLVEEELARALPHARKTLSVVMLRICTIVGSSERGEGPVRTFVDLPVGASILMRRGGLQFITEADLMRVMLKAMEAPRFSGTYNVAPDDYTTIAEVCRSLGKPRVPVPYSLLWLAFFLARRLDPRSPLTEKVVSYLAYPVVISNGKLKKALGVSFLKSSLEAFLECARALKAPGAAQFDKLPVKTP